MGKAVGGNLGGGREGGRGESEILCPPLVVNVPPPLPPSLPTATKLNTPQISSAVSLSCSLPLLLSPSPALFPPEPRGVGSQIELVQPL